MLAIRNIPQNAEPDCAMAFYDAPKLVASAIPTAVIIRASIAITRIVVKLQFLWVLFTQMVGFDNYFILNTFAAHDFHTLLLNFLQGFQNKSVIVLSMT